MSTSLIPTQYKPPRRSVRILPSPIVSLIVTAVLALTGAGVLALQVRDANQRTTRIERVQQSTARTLASTQDQLADSEQKVTAETQRANQAATDLTAAQAKLAQASQATKDLLLCVTGLADYGSYLLSGGTPYKGDIFDQVYGTCNKGIDEGDPFSPGAATPSLPSTTT